MLQETQLSGLFVYLVVPICHYELKGKELMYTQKKKIEKKSSNQNKNCLEVIETSILNAYRAYIKSKGLLHKKFTWEKLM